MQSRVPAAPGARAALRLRPALRALALPLALAACSELPSAPVIPAPASPGTIGDASASRSPLQGARLFVNPASPARRTVEEWRRSRPADAALLEKVASQPQVVWFGDWNPRPYDEVRRLTETVAASGAFPVYVLYGIPLRDCGQYSAGGMASPAAYAAWVGEVARGIGSRRAAVVLEPDALAGMDCLSAREQEQRLGMIRDAVSALAASGSVSVYLDAGNARWKGADEIADRLRRAGVAGATGFALNVSNFLGDDESVRYGEAVSQRLGGKHFVLDTSRNGLGPTGDAQWCNPSGRALGRRPTTDTGHARVDAFLWIKTPGESDGECNGGPAAGQWWAEYALGLARRAAW